MKLTGLGNLNPDTMAWDRMLVARTMWDSSGPTRQPLSPLFE
jgi:hypothetical protein